MPMTCRPQPLTLSGLWHDIHAAAARWALQRSGLQPVWARPLADPAWLRCPCMPMRAHFRTSAKPTASSCWTNGGALSRTHIRSAPPAVRSG